MKKNYYTGRNKYVHVDSSHLALWIASTLRAYTSVNQTAFYLKLQQTALVLQLTEISKHWVKN